MTGRQIKTGDNALPLTAFALAFSPVDPLSIAAFAALKVSFPGACPGKDGSLILTKRQIKTGDNALLLTAFALAFSPVSPFLRTTGRQRVIASLNPFSPRKPRFRRRCAPLKVSLWRRMSADATGNFILTGDNALPLTAFALAFSPVNPLSENDGKTTGNRLRLTRFLPVNPSFEEGREDNNLTSQEARSVVFSP